MGICTIVLDRSHWLILGDEIWFAAQSSDSRQSRHGRLCRRCHGYKMVWRIGKWTISLHRLLQPLKRRDAQRWLYYRDRTEGQNTILIDYQNQNVNAVPTTQWGSSNTSQGAAPSFDIPSGSTAFFTQDMSTAYNCVSQKAHSPPWLLLNDHTHLHDALQDGETRYSIHQQPNTDPHSG